MLASVRITHCAEVIVPFETTHLLLAQPIRFTLHANEEIHYDIVS